MAKFQLMRRRKPKTSATFHVDEDFSAGWRRRHAKPLGLTRTLFTALTLTFAMGSIYVALHYVPAFMSPSQVVRVSNADEVTMTKDRGPIMSVIGPYWDSLLARRTYVWQNERMEVRYARGAATDLSLIVERCARKPVMEVFRCDVVSQQRIAVDKGTGVQMLTIGQPGFYQFREEYSGEMPRVVWRRA